MNAEVDVVIKISELEGATSFGKGDFVPIVQSGTTKKVERSIVVDSVKAELGTAALSDVDEFASQGNIQEIKEQVQSNSNEQNQRIDRIEYAVYLIRNNGINKAYRTQALMLADVANIPKDSIVSVVNDPANNPEINDINGEYHYNGSDFYKLPNNILTLIDAKTREAKAYADQKKVEAQKYSDGLVETALSKSVKSVKLPAIPLESNWLEIRNTNQKTAIKASENGDLEIYGVNLTQDIRESKDGLDILSEKNQTFSLPLFPSMSPSIKLYVNQTLFAEMEGGITNINGLRIPEKDLTKLKVPSLPTDSSQSLLSLYADTGESLMELSSENGKTKIVGLDLSSIPTGNSTASTDSITNKPSFYIANGKTMKADENGVTEFVNRELINPIAISNNACLTVQPTGFSSTPVQTVLTKDGKTFPNPYRVLVIIPFYGQSLSVGSGGVPIYTTIDKNLYPDFVLKFKSFSTIFNRTGGSGIIRVIEVDELKEFDALRATDFGNNYTGQTIADHMGIAIAEALNEASDGCVMRSLYFCAGVGGTLITGLGRGSDGYKTLMNAITAAKLIAAKKGWTVLVPALCWQHGESGSGDPQYQPELLSLRNNVNEDIKAITGQNSDVHFYMANPASQRSASAMASSMAMYRLHRDMPTQFTQVGGVYEGAVRSEAVDWTHLNTNGYMQLSYRYAAAIVHDLEHGFGSYRAVSPKKITRTDNIIDIEFNVPNPPLQFKTTSIIPLAQNYGFSYIDDSSSASITSVELLNATTLRITLSATPTGANKRIRAGFTFGSAQEYASRPRTNLCDSTAGQTPLGDELSRFCLTFEEPVS